MRRRGEGVWVLTWIVSVDCTSREDKWKGRNNEATMREEELNTDQEETEAYQHCLYLVLCKDLVLCEFMRFSRYYTTKKSIVRGLELS